MSGNESQGAGGRRRYTLGRRAPAVAATRTRVLDAAAAELAERGAEHTSMQAVARRADVAAGTVLHHFPDRDALVAAVVDRTLERLALPRPNVLPVDGPPADRVRLLVEELHAFYIRSMPDYPLFVRNAAHPAFRRGLAEFTAARDALVDRALAGRSVAATARTAVDVLCDVGFFVSLTERGLTPGAATATATRLALCVLDEYGPGPPPY